MELEVFNKDLLPISEVTLEPGNPRRHSKLVHVSFRGYDELHLNHPPTTYAETMVNLFKGNVRNSFVLQETHLRTSKLFLKLMQGLNLNL